MQYHGDYTYLKSEGTDLFTAFLTPKKDGKFPVVIIRDPYVVRFQYESEINVTISYVNEYKTWLSRGYAVVIQHCRGRGKSEGECFPYIKEREDGINLQNWVRNQDFYNGEIFLKGTSYLTSVHYATAPFENDIKGAVFGVQDSERYNICYRNGFMKKGLHGNWYTLMYKVRGEKKYNYTLDSFNLLPLSDFTKTVFGEPVEDFDLMLKSPNPDDDFWNTRLGGSDARNATKNAHFPILFTTSFYDLYTGGIFDMWREMNEENRSTSALVVSPYDHSDGCETGNSIVFPKGKRVEAFGADYELDWFDYIRGIRKASPFKTGMITYYSLFENKWKSEKELKTSDSLKIKLGDETVSYVYNPYDAPSFKGGLSRAFGGALYQDEPNSRYDIISLYTAPFEEETYVKGKMSAMLSVSSDCEDTCFYIRISIEKEKGDYPLRDDITSLCYQLGDYTPSDTVQLSFDFDEHAFMIKKGERLRIDISSADNEHYVRHTNQKGLYSIQTTAKVARNSVNLSESYLILPVDNKNN